MIKSSSKTLAAHAYELAGMGTGPYSFCGIVEMPNLSENSATSFGSANPYAEVQSLKLKAGAGTCACCGMAITVICVVRDGAGDRWGVGSDCIEKIGDAALCSTAKVAVAKRRAKMVRSRNAIKREAQRQTWLDQPSTHTRAQAGETNRQFNARRDEEMQEAVMMRTTAAQARELMLADVLPVLDGGTEFFRSLASQLRHGPLSERQARCAIKCFPIASRDMIFTRLLEGVK
jgi:hypothetical protein